MFNLSLLTCAKYLLLTKLNPVWSLAAFANLSSHHSAPLWENKGRLVPGSGESSEILIQFFGTLTSPPAELIFRWQSWRHTTETLPWKYQINYYGTSRLDFCYFIFFRRLNRRMNRPSDESSRRIIPVQFWELVH